MKAHELKLDTYYFDDVKSGRKTFEVRIYDRSFEVDDILILREWKGEDVFPCYTRNFIIARIKYILFGSAVPGLSNGYCILGIEVVPVCEPDLIDDSDPFSF